MPRDLNFSEGNLNNINNITLKNTSVSSSNLVLQSVGNKLYFDKQEIGTGSFLGGEGGADTLSNVVNRSNITSNTVQFTNTNVSFVTSGKVGISNTNPNETLSVSGDIFTDGPIKFSQNINLETGSTNDGIKIGNFASDGTLGLRTISLGSFSARSSGDYSIGIGNSAGRTDQGDYAIAIGHYSGGGDALQGDYAIAIGDEAGRLSQSINAVAIGQDAGKEYQGISSVALGPFAGQAGQNNYAVAIGYSAGQTAQHLRSIVLNADSTALNTTQSDSFFVKPIRSVSDVTGLKQLYYDTSTNEIVYYDSP